MPRPWAPRCGMEYTGDEDQLRRHHGSFDLKFSRHMGIRSEVGDDREIATLINALFYARRDLIAIGGDWRNADLVRFALERTKYLPDWARRVDGDEIADVVKELTDARRRFIRITRLVQWTDCFGDHSSAVRALDRYIGMTLARTPDRLVWTPLRGHWEPMRAARRARILQARLDRRTESRREPSIAIAAFGELEIPSCNQYWEMRYGDASEEYWDACGDPGKPFILRNDIYEWFRHSESLRGAALHWTDRGAVNVGRRNDGSQQLLERRSSANGRDRRQTSAHDNTWAAVNVYNTRPPPREVTAGKMVAWGRWCLVRECGLRGVDH